MLELFDYYRSSASYRIRIALLYKGLDCQLTQVHLVEDGGQHLLEDFTQKNSQQLIPLLRDGENYINQSMAMLEYLEEKFPDRPLLPKYSLKKAQVRAFAMEVACEIHPLNNLRVLKYIKNDFALSDKEKMQWYFHWLHKGFTSLTAKLGDGPFCFGETPTFADLFLIPQIYNACRFEFDMSPFPELLAINDHCLKQEYFIKASPEERLKDLVDSQPYAG